MDYFIGQLLLVGFAFPPRNWALCNGQLMPINQNQALFSLLGTAFGGDGITTFALPDLRGRVAAGPVSGTNLGVRAGTETVTLLLSQNAPHTHTLTVSTTNPPTLHTAIGSTVGPQTGISSFSSTASGTMDPSAISTVGGQPHENRSPYLGLNWIIALTGIFPSRS